jgi:hypothetical protein
VHELLDPVVGTWDEVLVRQTFSQEDAEVILRIPICEHEQDHLAWHFDDKGRFSVKSAYTVHSLATSEVRQSGSSDGQEAACGGEAFGAGYGTWIAQPEFTISCGELAMIVCQQEGTLNGSMWTWTPDVLSAIGCLRTVDTYSCDAQN